MFFLLLVLAALLGPLSAKEAHISWVTDFDKALQEGKSKSKPLLLFFTGSDWCGWCTKLEKEVLQTEEFASLAGNQLIFVLVDFPLNKPLEPKLAEQNKLLQKKYDVKGFPTVILLSADGVVIGTTGYRPGGAKAYAEHLLKMISDFQGYRKNLSLYLLQEKEAREFTARDLSQFYLHALSHGDQREATLLLDKGLHSEHPLFFCLRNSAIL